MFSLTRSKAMLPILEPKKYLKTFWQFFFEVSSLTIYANFLKIFFFKVPLNFEKENFASHATSRPNLRMTAMSPMSKIEKIAKSLHPSVQCAAHSQ